MIEFTVKFLLAFSLKAKDQSKEKKSKLKDPKKKIQPEIIDPPYLFRLEKTCSAAHIEYQLLPVKCKLYSIDVLCWHNAAKIYTPDGIKLFKPVTKNGLTFVPVSIKHSLRDLSIDDLMALRNAVIEFQIYTDKNKLGAAAKANKTDTIYIKETDVDQKGFIDGYLDKHNLSFPSKKSLQSKRSDQLQSKSEHSDNEAATQNVAYQKNEVSQKMAFDSDFADILYDLIDYICDDNVPRDRIIFRDFVKACDPSSETNLQEPPSKVKKPEKTVKAEAKKEKFTKFAIQMQGEIFFTDADPIFKLETLKSELNRIFIIPHVNNLLTRFQKIYLNPLIVKVISIENFPEEYLKDSGITDIYCKYSIPYIADCKTIEKPVNNSMKFMESHFFATHNLPKIKLLEFLETRMLVVEVYGVQRYQNVIPQPKLFGEKHDDLNIWKLNSASRNKCLEEEDNANSRNLLLAYCSYDLSSLLKNVWDFRGKGQLHSPESRIINSGLPPLHDDPTSSDYSCEFWSHYSISLNQINLAGLTSNTTAKSHLKEWLLLEKNTLLNLEAYLLSPQSAALVLHQVSNTFKRLLLIVTNKDIAKNWFRNILVHNQKIVCEGLKGEDILTGFVIDNGNTFVVYVEGLSIGYILKLWQDLEVLTPEDGKVFFNTDQTYENRLYNICNKWTGFYIINMKRPLELIFKNQKIYVKGNTPLPCQKVLIKLNLMFLTNTMRIMFQHNLFPTLEELVSLDLEYGVPYAWKQLHSSIASETTDEITLHQNME